MMSETRLRSSSKVHTHVGPSLLFKVRHFGNVSRNLELKFEVEKAVVSRVQAEAAKAYARAAKLGLEAYNYAAEVKVRAERKAGGFLEKLEKNPGVRTDIQPVDTVSTGSQSEYKSVLTENGIDYRTANFWQELNKMPDDEFEELVSEMLNARPGSFWRSWKRAKAAVIPLFALRKQ